MRKNPIYQFKTETSIGIDAVPNEAMILVEDFNGNGIKQVFKIANTGMGAGSTIDDFIGDVSLWLEPTVIVDSERGGIEWDVAITYVTNDLAVEAGTPYIALGGSTGSLPSANGALWDPVAGAAQVQANWNEVAPAAVSFINNKPTVVNDLTTGGTTDVLSAQQGVTLEIATSNIIDGTQSLTNTSLIGDPTAPTALTGDSDFSVANTAFVQGELGLYVPLTHMAAVNGVATLGADQLIPSAQLPAIAINDIYAVADEAEMFLLDTVGALANGGIHSGDMAVLADGHVYVCIDNDGSDITHWMEINSPAVTPVKSDWAVTTVGDLAYIDNKPVIVDDLTTGGVGALLSAQQGLVLNGLVTNIVNGTTDLTDTDLLGTATAPTVVATTDDTTIATTAFVHTAVTAAEKRLKTLNFISAAGQQNYDIPGEVITDVSVCVNGVKIRGEGVDYNVNDDGTNTAVFIFLSATLNQWVSIDYLGV